MKFENRIEKRADGITAIKPFNIETAKPPQIKKWTQKKTNVPFTLNSIQKSNTPYCLRGFIPHTCDVQINEYNDLEQVTLGLLLYEITPTTSGLVYVPTSPFMLSNLESDIFEKFADFELYKHHIINAASDYIKEKKHKMTPEAIQHLHAFMHESTSYDYTFDFLLIPNVFSDYNIDIEYYRPTSNVWGQLFDNGNAIEIRHSMSKTLLAYIEKTIENELPKSNTNTFTGIQESSLIETGTYKRRERKRYSSNKDYPLIKAIRNHRLQIG